MDRCSYGHLAKQSVSANPLPALQDRLSKLVIILGEQPHLQVCSSLVRWYQQRSLIIHLLWGSAPLCVPAPKSFHSSLIPLTGCFQQEAQPPYQGPVVRNQPSLTRGGGTLGVNTYTLTQFTSFHFNAFILSFHLMPRKCSSQALHWALLCLALAGIISSFLGVAPLAVALHRIALYRVPFNFFSLLYHALPECYSFHVSFHSDQACLR